MLSLHLGFSKFLVGFFRFPKVKNINTRRTRRCVNNLKVIVDFQGFSVIRGLILVSCSLLLSNTSNATQLSLAEVLRLALHQNADIRVQQSEVDAARAVQQQAAGQFDWLLSSSLDYSKTVTPQLPPALLAQKRQFSTGYSVGLSRQLRNGFVFSGDMQAGSSESDPNNTQQNNIKLNVALTVPLLRGKGALATQANEDAAKLSVLRSRYDLRERAAKTIFSALLAYWDYRTRFALYNVALDSERRSLGLMESTQKLINAAEKPRADLVLLQADYGDKRANKEAAALALSETRKNLARLLGLSLADMRALAEPADDFPALQSHIQGLISQQAAINTLALRQRGDFQSLSLQMAALQRQLQAAQERLKPQLNVKLGVGYGRVSEGGSRYGFIGEAGRNQNEPSVSAQLSYQFPLENNVAGGALKELNARVQQLSYKQRDLLISVESGVDSALLALQSTAAQLQVAQNGLSLYEQAVKQEIIKQKNGIATLIDVINVEARFVSARVNYLQLQQAHANAIARLRYETGSFFPQQLLDDADTDTFNLDTRDLLGLGSLAKLLP